MKKVYSELELEVIRFGAEDIITASEDACDTDMSDYTYLASSDDGVWELYMGPNGHYYELNTQTGEFNDLGTDLD